MESEMGRRIVHFVVELCRGLAIAALVALAYNTTVWASPYGLIAFLSVTYIYINIYIYTYKHTISTQYSAITCLALRRSAIIMCICYLSTKIIYL